MQIATKDLPAITELRSSLASLHGRWEKLVVRAAAEDGATAQIDSGRRSLIPGTSIGIGGRLLDIHAISTILSFTPLQDRMLLRSISTVWLRAAEFGDAKVLWTSHHGAPASSGNLRTASHLASEYARKRLIRGKICTNLLRRGQQPRRDLPINGRLSAPSPAVPLADGTFAVLIDKASVVNPPDVALALFDTCAAGPIGIVPLKSVPHGMSFQRPLSITSLAPAAGSSIGGRQGCVAALQKLVVAVFWRVGFDAGGAPCLLDGEACEIRYGQGGREVLRGASFIGMGAGAAAPIAVLMEGDRDGPIVEVYRKGMGSTAQFELSESITVGRPRIVPKFGEAIPKAVGEVHAGRLLLWAAVGERNVDFAVLPSLLAGANAGAAHDATASPSLAALGDRAGGAAGAFARAMQTAKKGKLRYSADAGAGVDLEASAWGYIVEAIDDVPQQPDLSVGDCIISIGGQPLYALDDENTVHWRFGRNLKDGADIVILSAAQVKMIQDAGTSGSSDRPDRKQGANLNGSSLTGSGAGGSAPRSVGSKVPVHPVIYPARLEAWCVAAHSDPPLLLVVADNHLYRADLDGEFVAPKDILSAVVRAPHKRPATQVQLLDRDRQGDILVVGTAKAVLLWRVPSILGDGADAELLAAIGVPPRCSLSKAAAAIVPSHPPCAWLLADCGVPGSTTAGEANLDFWQFFAGGSVPDLPRGTLLGGSPSTSSALPGNNGTDVFSEGLAAAAESRTVVDAALSSALEKMPMMAKTADMEGCEQVAILRGWAAALPEDRAEGLYAAADKAEKLMTDALRDLRLWVRKHGRSGVASIADLAPLAIRWMEDFRRTVVWPLQSSFEAEGSGAGPDANADLALGDDPA